jgi:hypothetical protein
MCILSPDQTHGRLADGYQKLFGHLRDEDLLELYKQPGVGESVRAEILAQFEARCKRAFGRVWDLVEHLERHRADLDLAAPYSG